MAQTDLLFQREAAQDIFDSLIGGRLGHPCAFAVPDRNNRGGGQKPAA
jgi:hypothetical protein